MLRLIESSACSRDESAFAMETRDTWLLRVNVPPRRCLRRNRLHLGRSADFSWTVKFPSPYQSAR